MQKELVLNEADHTKKIKNVSYFWIYCFNQPIGNKTEKKQDGRRNYKEKHQFCSKHKKSRKGTCFKKTRF